VRAASPFTHPDVSSHFPEASPMCLAAKGQTFTPLLNWGLRFFFFLDKRVSPSFIETKQQFQVQHLHQDQSLSY
jgi:hypothetical protein